MKNISPQLEIFCGTGGVGKSTLAASRALYFAGQGKKVLLITIDPAKRLREILGLKIRESGTIKEVKIEDFELTNSGHLDILLMHPHATLKRFAANEADNRLLKILTKPHGGTNEIMAVLELDYHLKQNCYDIIILDTAPGKHFIDFLESSEKIKTFFDQSFIDIFINFEKKLKGSKEIQNSWNLFSNIVSKGIKKLLDAFSQVTGASFVEEFVEAINVLYRNKEIFIEAIALQEKLKKEKNCKWYLVTCAEQDKIKEALDLEQSAKGFLHHQNTLIMNKCFKSHLESWHPEDDNLLQIRQAFVDKEDALLQIAQNQFAKVLEFPQTLEDSIKKQVMALIKHWKEQE